MASDTWDCPREKLSILHRMKAQYRIFETVSLGERDAFED